MQILRLTPAECFKQWDDIEPFIQMAIEDEHYTSKDVKKFLLDGVSRAYSVVKGSKIIAVVTADLVSYPTSKIVRIHTAGGIDYKSWADDVINMAAKDGKDNGASEIQIIGRKGWLKVLSGFKLESVIIGKAI